MPLLPQRGLLLVCLPQGLCLLRRPDHVEVVDLEARFSLLDTLSAF